MFRWVTEMLANKPSTISDTGVRHLRSLVAQTNLHRARRLGAAVATLALACGKIDRVVPFGANEGIFPHLSLSAGGHKLPRLQRNRPPTKSPLSNDSSNRLLETVCIATLVFVDTKRAAMWTEKGLEVSRDSASSIREVTTFTGRFWQRRLRDRYLTAKDFHLLWAGDPNLDAAAVNLQNLKNGLANVNRLVRFAG